MARRDKKAFFSDQCKEIEENNRMGKTRDLFKKIRDTKGTFHSKMGAIKDRNGLDLTEAEFSSVQFISVAQSCPTLCDPMNHSTPGLLFITISRSSLRLMSIESMMPSSHLTLGVPFSSCPQSLPASESFPMSQNFS